MWSVTFTTKPESFITTVSLLYHYFTCNCVVNGDVDASLQIHQRNLWRMTDKANVSNVLNHYWFLPKNICLVLFLWNNIWITTPFYHLCLRISPYGLSLLFWHTPMYIRCPCMHVHVCVCALMAARDFVVFTVHVRKRCTQRACSMKVNRHMHNL